MAKTLPNQLLDNFTNSFSEQFANDVLHSDYEWAVRLNRISLRFLGVWPENNETKQKIIISNMQTMIILNITIWWLAIPTVHSLFRIWGNLMSMIDNLQYTLPMLMAIIKLFVIWQRKKDILSLLNMIKNDWLKPKAARERDVMIKRARIARIFTIFGYLIMLLSVILVVVLPAFGISMRYLTNKTDPGRLFPLQTYYIYDREKSPFYEITYILQSFAVSTLGIVYTSSDSFLSFLVFHICGQLKNLKTRITELDKFDNFERALARNVQDHIRLIRSINMIDNIFNLMLLGALIYFGILFALYGFLYGTIMSQSHEVSVPRLTFIITISINSFAHTCLYCAAGEILVAQYEGVYKVVCEYKWYNLEPKEARSLLFIMMQANRSLHLTAGKLFPMTMSTFCNLLKTSGGYISVLLAHQE